MTAFDEAAAARYVSFTTFRRTGEPVATPVWIAPDGDELLFVSEDPAGKLKRLRNNPAVELRPCSLRGEVSDGAPTWRGTATVHRDEPSLRRARRATGRKYPEARISNAVLPLLQRVGLVRGARAVVVVRLEG
jgi:PPOX class probable F420-dependent enzyme